MSTNITTPVVAADDDILAADWNAMRDDIIVNAGDYETAGGDGDTITLAIDSSISAYAAGQKFRFQANAANTGAVTLNVNAIGAIAVKKNHDEALVANDIESGQEVEVTYDGVNMQMQSPTAHQEHIIGTLNAGETIAGATLPVAVYQDTTDNKLYACDGNDTAKLKFIGFAISNSTDGNPIAFQGSGIVRGFTGLTEGVKYYVQDDKTIGVIAGTWAILVGVAISETELLIEKDNYKLKGQAGNEQIIGLETDQTISSTAYTKKKDAEVHFSGRIRVNHQVYGGTAGVAPILSKVYVNDIAVGIEHSTAEGATNSFSEDIDVKVGDNIQIYAKRTGTEPSGGTPYIRYMKLSVMEYLGATSVLD